MSLTHLVLATRNRHKVEELRALLNIPGLTLSSADDYPGSPEVVEDGDSFETNASKKAVALAQFTGLTALADDSGLETDALSGAPGVRSARYAGERATDAENLAKLLRDMASHHNRAARFRCVLALAEPNGRVECFEGVCEGELRREPCGRGGFGYDPIFVPTGHQRTFAEMESAEKNRLSHRARAIAALRERLLRA